MENELGDIDSFEREGIEDTLTYAVNETDSPQIGNGRQKLNDLIHQQMQRLNDKADIDSLPRKYFIDSTTYFIRALIYVLESTPMDAGDMASVSELCKRLTSHRYGLSDKLSRRQARMQYANKSVEELLDDIEIVLRDRASDKAPELEPVFRRMLKLRGMLDEASVLSQQVGSAQKELTLFSEINSLSKFVDRELNNLENNVIPLRCREESIVTLKSITKQIENENIDENYETYHDSHEHQHQQFDYNDSETHVQLSEKYSDELDDRLPELRGKSVISLNPIKDQVELDKKSSAGGTLCDDYDTPEEYFDPAETELTAKSSKIKQENIDFCNENKIPLKRLAQSVIAVNPISDQISTSVDNLRKRSDPDTRYGYRHSEERLNYEAYVKETDEIRYFGSEYYKGNSREALGLSDQKHPSVTFDETVHIIKPYVKQESPDSSSSSSVSQTVETETQTTDFAEPVRERPTETALKQDILELYTCNKELLTDLKESVTVLKTITSQTHVEIQGKTSEDNVVKYEQQTPPDFEEPAIVKEERKTPLDFEMGLRTPPDFEESATEMRLRTTLIQQESDYSCAEVAMHYRQEPEQSVSQQSASDEEIIDEEKIKKESLNSEIRKAGLIKEEARNMHIEEEHFLEQEATVFEHNLVHAEMKCEFPPGTEARECEIISQASGNKREQREYRLSDLTNILDEHLPETTSYIVSDFTENKLPSSASHLNGPTLIVPENSRNKTEHPMSAFPQKSYGLNNPKDIVDEVRSEPVVYNSLKNRHLQSSNDETATQYSILSPHHYSPARKLEDDEAGICGVNTEQMESTYLQAENFQGDIKETVVTHQDYSARVPTQRTGTEEDGSTNEIIHGHSIEAQNDIAPGGHFSSENRLANSLKTEPSGSSLRECERLEKTINEGCVPSDISSGYMTETHATQSLKNQDSDFSRKESTEHPEYVIEDTMSPHNYFCINASREEMQKEMTNKQENEQLQEIYSGDAEVIPQTIGQSDSSLRGDKDSTSDNTPTPSYHCDTHLSSFHDDKYLERLISRSPKSEQSDASLKEFEDLEKAVSDGINPHHYGGAEWSAKDVEDVVQKSSKQSIKDESKLNSLNDFNDEGTGDKGVIPRSAFDTQFVSEPQNKEHLPTFATTEPSLIEQPDHSCKLENVVREKSVPQEYVRLRSISPEIIEIKQEPIIVGLVTEQLQFANKFGGSESYAEDSIIPHHHFPLVDGDKGFEEIDEDVVIPPEQKFDLEEKIERETKQNIDVESKVGHDLPDIQQSLQGAVKEVIQDMIIHSLTGDEPSPTKVRSNDTQSDQESTPPQNVSVRSSIQDIVKEVMKDVIIDALTSEHALINKSQTEQIHSAVSEALHRSQRSRRSSSGISWTQSIDESNIHSVQDLEEVSFRSQPKMYPHEKDTYHSGNSSPISTVSNQSPGRLQFAQKEADAQSIISQAKSTSTGTGTTVIEVKRGPLCRSTESSPRSNFSTQANDGSYVDGKEAEEDQFTELPPQRMDTNETLVEEHTIHYRSPRKTSPPSAYSTQSNSIRSSQKEIPRPQLVDKIEMVAESVTPPSEHSREPSPRSTDSGSIELNDQSVRSIKREAEEVSETTGLPSWHSCRSSVNSYYTAISTDERFHTQKDDKEKPKDELLYIQEEEEGEKVDILETKRPKDEPDFSQDVNEETQYKTVQFTVKTEEELEPKLADKDKTTEASSPSSGAVIFVEVPMDRLPPFMRLKPRISRANEPQEVSEQDHHLRTHTGDYISETFVYYAVNCLVILILVMCISLYIRRTGQLAYPNTQDVIDFLISGDIVEKTPLNRNRIY